MIALSPLARSWQKTTCSWPASFRWSVRSKTATVLPFGLRCCSTSASPCGTRHGGEGGVPHARSLTRCDDADVTAYAAHLRVYEPLAAFEGDERRRWEAYVRAGNIPSV